MNAREQNESDRLTNLPELARKINEAHAAAYEKARSAVEHARTCGEMLIQAKESIGHGGFLAWLAANCHVGERQARNYMRVAREWEAIAKSAMSADLTITEALALTAKPDESWADVVRRESLRAIEKLPFGLPDLDRDFSYTCLGRNETLLLISPRNDAPGRWWVAVISGLDALDSEEPEVRYMKRGVPEIALALAIVHLGGEPVWHWTSSPAMSGLPWYLVDLVEAA